jgi:hypothetical protein
VSQEPSQVEPGIHPKLTNPLSEETRKERLYLLGTSAIGITIVFTGLIPTEIRTLGITFAEADRTSLLLIFALVVGYFLVAFVSYALSDYVEWNTARRDLYMVDRGLLEVSAKRAMIQAELDNLGARQNGEEDEEVASYRKQLASLERHEQYLTEQSIAQRRLSARPIINLRFAFEFLLPPIVGAFAIAVLLIKAL